MNRIDQLFKEKKHHVLNVYCTAGYPHLNSTVGVIASLQAHGADIVEIGMPYSDPLADGPVIQHEYSCFIRATGRSEERGQFARYFDGLHEPDPAIRTGKILPGSRKGRGRWHHFTGLTHVRI